jgi:hypothetical protein
MKRWARFVSWLRGVGNLEVGRALRPTPGKVFAAVAIFSLLSLVYLVGAAVMYFRWPTSVFMTKAFMGAEDWSQRAPEPTSRPSYAPSPINPTVIDDHKGVACDGFTLCMSSQGPRVTLVDMKGTIVHQWKMNSRLAWTRAPGVRDPLPDEAVHWDHCYVYPDGALLALCARTGDPYGYALIKLDRNSNLLWAYSGNVHHDFDVGDDGRIYVLTQHLEANPPPGLPGAPTEYQAEDLVVLSPEGKPLTTIPLYEAFQKSPFAMLYTGQLMRTAAQAPDTNTSDPAGKTPTSDARVPVDILHANSVKVLPQALAAQFPLFKPGWVLLSFRRTSIISLLDSEKGTMVWAALGPWQAQHDAQFLANGHLLLFDNAGSRNGPRILEYDPWSQGIAWAYTTEEADRQMRAPFRGACQRLPNGNTLIIDVLRRGVFEVTPGKETVWESLVPGLIRARRYTSEELPFLPEGTAPRNKK